MLQGRDSASRTVVELRHRFSHFLVDSGLPAPILDSLLASGGGICVPLALARPKLVDFCQRLGLQLWVFSTKGPRQTIDWASRDGVDVVFCDDLPSTLEAIAR